MPNFVATLWYFSVFSLASRAFPDNLDAAFSNLGAIVLHGPHHGAQKSTTNKASSRAFALSNIFGDNSDTLDGIKPAPQLAHFGP
jgi:hypothetical protein